MHDSSAGQAAQRSTGRRAVALRSSHRFLPFFFCPRSPRADALSSEALAGIYVAKGRPSDNPLIVHVHSHEQFLSLGRNIPRLALRLADRFWPGPLTLIIPTALGEGAASSAARAGLDCVGVRMPNHPVALALLRACGVPLAAPSANLSGRPSPTTAAHVATDLMGRVAGIVDGGASEGVGLESTVVECEDAADGADGGGWVTILRPGGITREMLEEVAGVGRVRIDPAIAVQEVQLDQTAAPVQALPKQSAKRGTERADLSSLLGSPSPCPCPSPAASVSASVSPVAASPSVSASASASGASTNASPSPGPKAPGMKYTHYAPRAPLLLVDGDGDDQGGASLLLRTADSYLSRGDVVGVLATEELRPRIEQWRAAKGYSDAQLQLLVCGRRADLATVARGLYAALRAFDDTHVQIIVSEMFPADGGMGEAIMNRLHKAAGGKIVREDAAAAVPAATAAVAQQ